jgi:hypothetical protein
LEVEVLELLMLTPASDIVSEERVWIRVEVSVAEAAASPYDKGGALGLGGNA